MRQILWETQIRELSKYMTCLPDKPEEAPDSTLRALWHTAAGTPRSAEAAVMCKLPELDDRAVEKLSDLVHQRISGVPLAHISRRQRFLGVEMLTGPEALVPRKETEILGRAALQLLREMETTHPAPIVVDVCTGAGNLAIALSIHRPNLTAFGTDISPDAVSLARKNVKKHRLGDRVEMLVGDLLEPFNSDEFHESVDLIVCNPPYISTRRVDAMPEEISKYEPRLAFDGGPFGVNILCRLLRESPKYLTLHGWLAFEVGLGQGPMFAKRLEKHQQFGNCRFATDRDGHIRTICTQRIG